MKKLIILRGISGSGKSTYAEELVDEFYSSDSGKEWIKPHYQPASLICSADEYFVRPDGIYDFSFKTLKNAHEWCWIVCEDAMTDSTALIIIDNTNTRHWEYEPYLKLAEKFGYEVEIKIVGEFGEEFVRSYAERNTHGVPVEKVIEMAKRFEL